MKKILVIYPSSSNNDSTIFYIFDPDTGEALASHLCSDAGFAKSDLHDGRPERLAKWEKRYGKKTEAKFVEETDYKWEEIYKKNQELKNKKTT